MIYTDYAGFGLIAAMNRMSDRKLAQKIELLVWPLPGMPMLSAEVLFTTLFLKSEGPEDFRQLCQEEVERLETVIAEGGFCFKDTENGMMASRIEDEGKVST